MPLFLPPQPGPPGPPGGGATTLAVVGVGVGDSPYNVPATGVDAILVDTSGGAVDINLGAAASNDGRILRIKDVAGNAEANNITIHANGADTIDQNASFVMDVDEMAIDVVAKGSTNVNHVF